MTDDAAIAPWWVVTRDLRLIRVEGSFEDAAAHGRPLRRVNHYEAHSRSGTHCEECNAYNRWLKAAPWMRDVGLAR